jgi:hypothetical protein
MEEKSKNNRKLSFSPKNPADPKVQFGASTSKCAAGSRQIKQGLLVESDYGLKSAVCQLNRFKESISAKFLKVRKSYLRGTFIAKYINVEKSVNSISSAFMNNPIMASLRAFEYLFLPTNAHVVSTAPTKINTKENPRARSMNISLTSVIRGINNKANPISGDIHANIVHWHDRFFL